MKIRNQLYLTITLTVICLSLALVNSGAAEMTMKHGSGHDMTMHHQHTMLNHALSMALEGSNMVMLGQMGMSPGVDEMSVKHGEMMMKDAKALWDEIMSGDTMKKMHAEGKSPKDDPAMAYTHELAEAQLKVMDLLSKMPAMTK
jgi:polyhydroxyalkanoate synthesis regulator phasin